MTSSGSSFVSGDPESSVAICTLSSFPLLEALSNSPLASRVAIIGPLETQNIGLEQMVTTLLRRPRIRTLVVCGDEARGRYQGQALLGLFQNGVDDQSNVLGARSRRARLPTLGPQLVEQVRRQVTLRDLVGCHDLEVIGRAVDDALAADPAPFAEQVDLPTMPTIEVPQQPFRLREHDPSGFFVIAVDADAQRIVIDHYTVEGEHAHRIAGPDAESLCVALVEWGLVTRLEHAAYLGRELVRAEHALQSGTAYRQDERV